MDYLCDKFGDFGFNRFGFIVRTKSQNHRRTIDYSLDYTVGVSNNRGVHKVEEGHLKWRPIFPAVGLCIYCWSLMLSTGWRKKTGPPYLIANILKIP